jgi:hypothetical protein
MYVAYMLVHGVCLIEFKFGFEFHLFESLSKIDKTFLLSIPPYVPVWPKFACSPSNQGLPQLPKHPPPRALCFPSAHTPKSVIAPRSPRLGSYTPFLSAQQATAMPPYGPVPARSVFHSLVG